MIQVIGQDQSVAKRISCWGCGAVLEYHNTDVVTHYTKRDYLGDRESFQGITCPKCNSEVNVNRR